MSKRCKYCNGKCTCRICEIGHKIKNCMMDARQKEVIELLYDEWDCASTDNVFDRIKLEEIKKELSQLHRFLESNRVGAYKHNGMQYRDWKAAFEDYKAVYL